MSSSGGQGPADNLEVDSATLRGRSSPYDYVVVMSSNGRSVNLYKGRSPGSAMTAYGQAVDVTKFLGCSAKIEIMLTEVQSPYSIFGGFASQVEDGRTTAYHRPYGGCAEWPILAGATFKPEVRWQGILMFPLYEAALKAHQRK